MPQKIQLSTPYSLLDSPTDSGEEPFFYAGNDIDEKDTTRESNLTMPAMPNAIQDSGRYAKNLFTKYGKKYKAEKHYGCDDKPCTEICQYKQFNVNYLAHRSDLYQLRMP